MIQTAVVGGYPKTLHNQILRKTLHLLDRNPRQKNRLESVLPDLTRAAVEEQLELGLDWVSDGGLRRQDEVTYFCGPLGGVRLDGLLRYFDTNVYFRQPVVAQRPKLRAPFLSRDYQEAWPFAGARLQLVVTGPLTLAALSRNESRLSFEQLAEAYAEALHAELLKLDPVVTRLVLLEPAFLQRPEKAALLQKLVRKLASLTHLEIILYVYFGNAAAVWKTLWDLEVAGVGFDFTYTPRGEKLLSRRWDKKKIFYAGLIDARNTKLETKAEIFPTLRRLGRHVAEGKLYVTPSANLEFLPLDRCRLKLSNMVRLVNQFNLENR